MHIEKLEVKGFGKLAYRTILLKKGINVIYGNNETGKTTLQWFIRGMLYGLKNNRQAKNGLMPPLKRFEPWEGGQYGGALVYTLEDGSTYRVERNFESGEVQLFDSYFNNITDSFDIGRDKMPIFAQQQLSLDEETFERTVLIRQLEIRLDADSTAALANRLANVSSSGFEEISFSRAEKALIEARKINVGTGRTTTQPLDKLEARLKQLEAERGRLQRQQEKRHSTWEELRVIQNRRSSRETEKRFLEHIGGLIEVRKALDINLKKEIGLKAALKNLKELERALDSTVAGEGRLVTKPVCEGRASLTNTGTDVGRRLTHRKQKRSLAPVLCLTAAVFFAVILGYTAATKEILSSWLLLLVHSIGLLSSTIAGLLAYRKVCTHQAGFAVNTAEGTGDTTIAGAAEIRALVKNICSSASLLCERQLNEPDDVKQALKDIAAKLEELSKRLEQGIEAAADIEYNSTGYFNMNDLDTVFYDSDIAGLEEVWKNDMESVKKGFLDATLREKYFEGLLEDGQVDSDDLQRVEEETVAVKEKITYLKHKGNALKLAHEVLLEAGIEIKRTFAPGFDSSMSAIITGLTAGRYVDLRGDDTLALKVAIPESGDIKSALMLSGAATDQMYLALRLAMAGLLTAEGESLPLIMDEVFSQFDDHRTALALKYLYNAYEKKQVIIFTCKQREVELAREIYGKSLNLVEL